MRSGSRSIGLPPCGLAGKESACNAGDLGSIPGLGRSPGEGKGYPLQYSGLKDLYSPWGRKESDMTKWLSLPAAERAFLQGMNLSLAFCCPSLHSLCHICQYELQWEVQSQFSYHGCEEKIAPSWAKVWVEGGRSYNEFSHIKTVIIISLNPWAQVTINAWRDTVALSLSLDSSSW